MKLIYETKGLTRIRIYEEGKHVLMRLGRGSEVHSIYDPEEVLIPPIEECYWNYFNLIPAITECKKVLLIGLAGGTMVRSFAHYYPDIELHAVEIDPTIVEVARMYMDLNHPKLVVHIGDGTKFLEECTMQFDAVVLDAFSGGNLDTSFCTVPIISNAKKCLREGGLFVCNYFDEKGVPYLVKRAIGRVFTHMQRIPLVGTYNYVLFASDSELNLKNLKIDSSLQRLAHYVHDNVRVDK